MRVWWRRRIAAFLGLDWDLLDRRDAVQTLLLARELQQRAELADAGRKLEAAALKRLKR